jgi:hypothetical protein
VATERNGSPGVRDARTKGLWLREACASHALEGVRVHESHAQEGFQCVECVGGAAGSCQRVIRSPDAWKHVNHHVKHMKKRGRSDSFYRWLMEVRASLKSTENAQIHCSEAKTPLLVVIWPRGGMVVARCHVDRNRRRHVASQLARVGLPEEHSKRKTA